MNDPNLDRRLADYLAEREAEQRAGVSLESVHRAVRDLADALSNHIEEDRKKFARNDDMWRRFRDWRHEVRGIMSSASRPRLPTLNPDDSGSIDVSGLGARVKLSGTVPVRMGVVVILVTLLVFAGYSIRAAGFTLKSATAVERKP